ncbi:hypothetical protein QBC35DRAFT_379502 [Podospora australis]|uniref:Transcriptional activator n=1 Tax=Podospora australis TaxID=1536484 RepID=A0AAN7AJS3_9PEZI|nr:hypothetical protein QBC35DRAFT_379502 [Podospora australis]
MPLEIDDTGKAGIVIAPPGADLLELFSHIVLDDILYTLVHDLVIDVHRKEKKARASTAAIKVEKLAANSIDSSMPDQKPDVDIETDAAIYKKGKVMLKGNPLKTTKEIFCPRCNLPKLLYPTEGKGAKKPDPSIIYCKRHPYIEKPGFDIYGQTWIAPGPGRGKKKKDVEKNKNGDDSPVPGAEVSAKDRPPNVLGFPSATCPKCKRCILVSRLNNHMGSCIGNGGRNASRAATQKINSNAGSQNGENTPPGSQKGTPLPGSRAGSPRKRDGDEYDEDAAEESDPIIPKKKKLKANALNKKVILKTKSPATMAKKDKTKGSSHLSVEHKAGDGDEKPPKTTAILPPKKINAKGPSPAKKIKIGKPPVPSPGGKKAGKKDRDLERESSGTLSSPPR